MSDLVWNPEGMFSHDMAHFLQANEIAFINSLEAQNKRLDIMTKYQESEARLQDIQVRNMVVLLYSPPPLSLR